jgi:TrmH family RNA methyltransferase
MASPFYASSGWRTIDKRTDEVQLLEALRSNRQKRDRQQRFVVEGVRNIDAAVASGWTIHTVIGHSGAPRSRWADGVAAATEGAERLELAPTVFDLLTDRDQRPELLLVVEIPRRLLDDLPSADAMVVVVLDRIANPGNLGTIVRTADALGAHAIVTVGHSAHAYDPQTVRASTGSLFAVPVVPVDGPAELEPWCRARRMTIVALDEAGDADLTDVDITRPCALVLGNETSGLSQALRDMADITARIPIGGTASSLNIAVATGIVLHELARRVQP